MNMRTDGQAREADFAALSRLAEVINPTSIRTANLLRDLRSANDNGATALLHSALADTASTVVGKPVRVVFAGHFSSGKSSVINALLGRPLLPTSDYPETGVPCVIKAGQYDRIQAVTVRGRVDLPFTRRAIAHEVSMIGDDGDYRDHVGTIEQVTVELAVPAVPVGVEWIDSPGINDTDVTTQRAQSVATGADVLIWVVNSRHPLSEVEQEFLHSHAETHGRDGVLFVVNVFLADDTEQDFASYLSGRQQFFQNRVTDIFGQEPTNGTPLFISARGALAHPNGFGFGQLRERLQSLRDERHPIVRATRAHRAVRDLQSLADQLQQRINIEQQSVDRAKGQWDASLARASRQRSAFAQQVQREVASSIATHGRVTAGFGPYVAAQLAVGDLRYDGHYGTELTTMFTASVDDLATAIIRSVNECCKRNGHSALMNATALRNLLRPSPITIFVPKTPPKKSGSGWGALLGGIVGSLVAPGPGTAAGAAMGAALGSTGAENRRIVEQDRAATRDLVMMAAAAAAREVSSKADAVGRLVLQACRPLDQSQERPDRRVLDSLDALRTHVLGELVTSAARERDRARNELVAIPR